MEIYLKTQHEFKKINWFSSIPEKFKGEIKQHLLRMDLDFNEDHTYQVVVNLPRLT